MYVGGSGSTGSGASETTLQAVLTELQDKLDDGGTVELGSDTIANILTALQTANGPIESALNDSLDALADILLELDQKIEAGDIVGLDAATITALQTISATILNQPTDFPDSTAHTKLDALLTDTGDAGASPPVGSGMLGFLRGIYNAITGTLTVSGPLTDTQLRASSVPVTVSDGSGPITVDGTVEITNDVGNPIPVSGSVTVSDGAGPLTVDGTVAVSNFPATQPVSAASLPLPAGAATSANQTNGTQATSVNNGAGAAAVNVQDGGNSLTVDGSVNMLASTNGLQALANNSDATTATSTTNKLAVMTQALLFNGSAFERVRVANATKTALATASGDTALWTPASGKKFRVMSYQIQITANASLAAGAILEILLRDATTSLNFGMSVFIPTIAVTTTPGLSQTPWVTLGNGTLSAAANNVLNINLSAALVTGEVRVVVTGTEE